MEDNETYFFPSRGASAVSPLLFCVSNLFVFIIEIIQQQDEPERLSVAFSFYLLPYN